MIKLTGEQENAVTLCTDRSERIASVTGGAGTGKTFVLGHAFKESKSAVLCAPTGRAAKRIQELTGIGAKTIHRLLEFPMPDDPLDLSVRGRDGKDTIEVRNIDTNHEPKRNKFNPLEYQTVYVDESSMLGQTLCRQLIDAMPAGGVVRFFGDMNQLPPVEEGVSPFLRFLEDKPAIRLTMNFRNDDEIISNANRILAGSVPLRNSRFEVIYSEDPVLEMLAFADKQYASAENQIIMAQRKGKWGTMRVNTSLQLKYNPSGPMLRLDRFDDTEAPLLVRPFDKFLWIKNDYNLRLFNGELGQIDWVNEEDGAMGLATPDAQYNVPARIKTYSPYLGHNINYDPRKQIELGYGITTHKSQGSEFDTVVYCMTGHASFLLNRQNFYTAVTRAKRRVIVITDRTAMSRAMRKAKPR